LLTKRTYFVSALLVCLATAAPASANVLDAPARHFRRTIEVTVTRIEAARKARARRERRQLYAALPAGVSLSTLEAIASCESGSDPAAVSSDGTYRGKYQFDYGTWESVGGSGDPAATPEAEQDYRAALLYSRSGSSPWPVCG
jgi:soluble lytic murein transglycosylase-like protein